jgi:GT2 family glycosyltransferase
MSPKLSVVICSFNGAPGVDRCARALARQTIRSSLEIIVVDDGSTDATSDVGRRHGGVVIRHTENLGLATARNSGLYAATAPIVAFLDDDCEPEPQWAEQVLAGYEEGVTGVGGPIVPAAHNGFMLGYLRRNNPLRPQELNLAKSERLFYRLNLYLQRQWTWTEDFSRREIYCFAGANMSFLRQAIIDVGRFDERFCFGGEDQDLCMRLTQTFPSCRLVFVPKARVVHHFKSSMRDTLRRSRAYGRGSARLFRKWQSVPPTFFPGPLVVLAPLLLSRRHPSLAVVALTIPHLLYPKGLHFAITSHSGRSFLDAYVQLAQEVSGNIGFLEGLWQFRYLIPEADTEVIPGAGTQAVRTTEFRKGMELVP